MSTDINKITVKDLLENYWYSRGLVLIGILLAFVCPFANLLLPIIMLMDLLVQNPVLPFGDDLRPQETFFEYVFWLQSKYTWMKEQYKRLKVGKTKKPE